jgi:transcriptional repressor NrdR
MLCPYCFHDDSKVIDKRDNGGVTRRRRECMKCTQRYNTHERVDKVELRVLKKDGRREEFDKDKVRKGIERACEKRPVSDKEVEKMVMKIEERTRKRGKEVKSDFIGEQVSRELKKKDKVSYIRFASVYKDFSEMDDFKKEIRGLIKG